MMWKKGLFLLFIGFCAFNLTGCTDVYDLTEEETKLIAEYSAGLLLKYDLNFDDRIEEGNQEAEKMSSEEELNTEETSSEMTTEATTESEESTEVPTTETAPDNDKESSVGTEDDIAKIVGIEGASIQYSDYLITNQYPATDEDGEFIYLEASEGYQLLVLRFGIQNVTDKAVDISLIDKEIDYRIVCNGVKAANPMLTILMDDLGTLDTSVNAGDTQNAVLIFQISNDMKEKLDSIDLYIDYNEMENLVKIL